MSHNCTQSHGAPLGLDEDEDAPYSWGTWADPGIIIRPTGVMVGDDEIVMTNDIPISGANYKAIAAMFVGHDAL